jgi:hypothetical protein
LRLILRVRVRVNEDEKGYIECVGAI